MGPREQVKNFDCRCKCSEKFSENEKEKIFKRFNKFQTWSEQTLYLQSLCRPTPVAQRRKRLEYGGKERGVSFNYHFELKRDGHLATVKVCQKAFCSLLGITPARLRKKVQGDREDHADGRGSHHNRPNRTPEESLEKVREFISSLAPRESHFSRADNQKRKYLDASMTVAGLHKEFIRKNPDLETVIPYNRFYEIFTTEFNIGIGYPRSDLCDSCELLNAKLREAQQKGDKALEKKINADKELHLRRAESFFTRMKEIKKSVENDPASVAICFDYEKNFPLPVTGAAPEYFRRQLWLYNICIYDIGTDAAKMFVYAEHFALKGPNEVVSILSWYFANVLSENVKNLHIFADNCGAQNKNRFLWAFLQSTVESGRFNTITMAYPMPGHSFMPCDRAFGLIEKKRKKLDRVLLPSQWIELIKNARPRNPFQVIFVEHPLTDDLKGDGTDVVKVLDYKKALTKVIATTVKDISKMKGVVFSRDGVRGRTTMNGDAMIVLSIRKRGISAKSLQHALSAAVPAYSTYISIKEKKFIDIKCLLERIPLPETATFYTSISGNGSTANDSDGSDDESEL